MVSCNGIPHRFRRRQQTGVVGSFREGAVVGVYIAVAGAGINAATGAARFLQRVVAQGADNLELWEMPKTGIDDEVITPTIITRKQIEAVLETRAEDFGQPFLGKALRTGEIYLDDIAENCTFTIKYRPDQYPDWILWQTLHFCATTQQCAPPPGCSVFKPNARLYAKRFMLKQPDDACNTRRGKNS